MKKNILVIDDRPFFLRVLYDVLVEEFRVETANSAEEAIDLLKGSDNGSANNPDSFDLVITDLNMPGLSGYDVAKFIRGKNREKKFTPVIMLTEMDLSLEEARKHGRAAYLPKSNLDKVKSLSRILLSR